MPTAFITGVSSGLGLGLTEVLLEQGWSVHGLSRRSPPIEHERFSHSSIDLADHAGLERQLAELLGSVSALDLVVLNAGILGRIQPMRETTLDEIRQAMDINVWANKLILDWLLDREIPIDQVVGISSGAAVNGHAGWGAYALSKVTLNMLMQLYAPEFPDSHLVALAPGLVDTAMQDYLCERVDRERFPSVGKLIDARGTEQMPDPATAAGRVVELLPRLKSSPSGSFIDVRDL